MEQGSSDHSGHARRRSRVGGVGGTHGPGVRVPGVPSRSPTASHADRAIPQRGGVSAPPEKPLGTPCLFGEQSRGLPACPPPNPGPRRKAGVGHDPRVRASGVDAERPSEGWDGSGRGAALPIAAGLGLGSHWETGWAVSRAGPAGGGAAAEPGGGGVGVETRGCRSRDADSGGGVGLGQEWAFRGGD